MGDKNTPPCQTTGNYPKGRKLVTDSSMEGEIMKRANLLFKSKGKGALDYANKMLDSVQESGDEEDKAYWFRITQQIELLVDEN